MTASVCKLLIWTVQRLFTESYPSISLTIPYTVTRLENLMPKLDRKLTRLPTQGVVNVICYMGGAWIVVSESSLFGHRMLV